MGSKVSKRREQETNKYINEKMRASNQAHDKMKKILVIGSSSVGKTTVCKSILSSYIDDYFDQVDRQKIMGDDYTDQARKNCVWQMWDILTQIGLTFDNDGFGVSRSSFKSVDEYIQNSLIAYDNDAIYEKKWDALDDDMREDINFLDPTNLTFTNMDNNKITKYGEVIDRLWKLKMIQQTYIQRTETKVWCIDNMEYWFNKIKILMDNKYITNIDDYMRVQLRTTGIDCREYKDAEKCEYKLYDVGGERSERAKWRTLRWNQFDCILFVCGLNQYCTVIFEDSEKIGLLENLQVFKEVVNNKWLENKKVVILLNKMDIFKEFLLYTPLGYCFGDEYKGKNYKKFPVEMAGRALQKICELLIDDNNVDITIPDEVFGIINSYCNVRHGVWLDMVCEDGIQFIKQKFLEISPNIEVYAVSAIDTPQIKLLMDNIHEQLQE